MKYFKENWIKLLIATIFAVAFVCIIPKISIWTTIAVIIPYCWQYLSDFLFFSTKRKIDKISRRFEYAIELTDCLKVLSHAIMHFNSNKDDVKYYKDFSETLTENINKLFRLINKYEFVFPEILKWDKDFQLNFVGSIICFSLAVKEPHRLEINKRLKRARNGMGVKKMIDNGEIMAMSSINIQKMLIDKDNVGELDKKRMEYQAIFAKDEIDKMIQKFKIYTDNA